LLAAYSRPQTADGLRNEVIVMINELRNVVDRIREQRYPGANVLFLCGSVVRGEGTETSDIDLVVLFDHLTQAYRETFRFDNWPVEAFVHDPETLRYFFLEQDRSAGVPVLMSMVAEGIELPGVSELSKAAKQLASSVIDEGPKPWSSEQIERSRYTITNLVDDLRDPRSTAERFASGAALYEALATHYFRAQGLWAARGKSIPRKLHEADAKLASSFESAFTALFENADARPVVEFAEHVLTPHGGFLFEGYTALAPAEWRSR